MLYTEEYRNALKLFSVRPAYNLLISKGDSINGCVGFSITIGRLHYSNHHCLFWWDNTQNFSELHLIKSYCTIEKKYFKGDLSAANNEYYLLESIKMVTNNAK